MKKLILCLAAAVVSLTAAADEGMWLLPYLQKMNIGDMKAKGCQLTAEDIYSVNHGSLKDAIVIFGNGCTGEVVSPEGLVFTNHHCGYGSIQALSSVEHDYLKDGFWAMSNEEELPAPGLTVTFIRRIIDVTPEVLGNIPSIAKGEERKVQNILGSIWEYYVNHIDELPVVYQSIADDEGPQRAVCDYVSGMTDSYALEVYSELFIPAAWTIK